MVDTVVIGVVTGVVDMDVGDGVDITHVMDMDTVVIGVVTGVAIGAAIGAVIIHIIQVIILHIMEIPHMERGMPTIRVDTTPEILLAVDLLLQKGMQRIPVEEVQRDHTIKM